MVLKIFLHHLVADVARAPRAVPDGPEVTPPVPLAQRRILLLKSPTAPPLEPLDEVGERSLRRVLDVHVDVVFAHHALEYPHILGIADLHEQVAAPHLDVTRQDGVAILCHPY